MISRVAENLYWLARYVERFETSARLLRVTHQTALDVPGTQPWMSILIVQGAQPDFLEHHPVDAQHDDDIVSAWLTWDAECPVSIFRSLRGARENARMTREVVSREVWEALNRAWLWFTSDEARLQYEEDRDGFYARVRDAGHQVRGAAIGTMLRDTPLRFMELGMYLERAEQTARTLDVRYHLVQPEMAAGTMPTIDTIAWLLTLLSCSAYEGYLKHHSGVRGKDVAGFLLLEPSFPRSILFALEEAVISLTEAIGDDKVVAASGAVAGLTQLRDHLRTLTPNDLAAARLHDDLTQIVDGLIEVGSLMYAELFHPRIPTSAQESAQ